MKKQKGASAVKWKSLLGPAILLLAILAGVLVIVFWKGEPEPQEIVRVNAYEGGDGEVVMENERLRFVMDSTTTQFYIEDKKSGQIWRSNPEGAGEDALALSDEKDNLQSTLTLTYSTINGVDTLYNNYKYSIQNGIYDIEVGDDYIKVFYSVGDMEKEYMIPPVILEEKMDALMEKMDKSGVMLVEQYYKKYDINNLGKNDDREELLASYPILETEIAYVLRSTTRDNVKVKFEQFFEEAGYTAEDYAEDKAMDMTESSSEKPVFNVNVVYRLEGDDLLVEVPLSEIEYKEDYPLLNLTILPYFGAGGTQEEGFLLVPEGGGALIDFNNGKLAQNSYYANLYGWDMAQGRTAVVHETRTSFNVFGISKEKASFVCILEEGASYAAIQADISGRKNSYNYANAVFGIAHREQYDVADRYNGEMYVYEEELPDEVLVERYRFIDADGYVEMARAYKGYLNERYGDAFVRNEDAQTPAVIEILGAVDKVKQVLGIPVSRPLKLTSYREAAEIVQELSEDGMTNLYVKLSGWMNGGVQQKVLNKVNLISDLGNRKALKSLIDCVAEKGGSLYLDGVTDYAYDSGVTDGFIAAMDAARFVSKEVVKLHPYSTVTYTELEAGEDYYLLKGSSVTKMAENLLQEAEKLNAGVSFQNMGYELSSDFDEEEKVTRQAQLKNQSALLKEARSSGQSIMVNGGNDYVIAYCDIVTNMDLNGSEYTILDRTVPFYQLAIHGYVNYTGESLNLAQDYEDELLQSAEYGAGLSFTVMEETAFALQKTLYTKYFGADYHKWHDRMVEIYTRYNEEMGHVFRQEMTDHEWLAEKLSCTTYEDGTKVYVNYGYQDMEIGEGNVVPARDYKVVSGAAE